MRFLALFSPALLAATAFAAEESSSSSSSSAATESPVEEPIPVGQLWTSKWTDNDLSPYTKHCHSTTKFSASIYTLSQMYPHLKEWAPELKVFYNKQLYPGSWEGIDEHGGKRELLKMDYESLPYAVREWLKKETKQRHFSMQDDVVFFAPGAIYPILPLWVEEAEGDSLGECEGVFDDLDNYSNDPKDGVVIGKVTHQKISRNEVEFTVEAFQIKAKAEQKRDEL